MEKNKKCNDIFKSEEMAYLVEYYGDFLEQISNVDYACGYIVNSYLAIAIVEEKNLDRLREEIPAITFVERPSMYVLQDIKVGDVDSIAELKLNPYLGLNGNGVLVGIIDTGIDYLNRSFINEDGSTRIVELWDQEIGDSLKNGELSNYIGTVYSREMINKALDLLKNNGDPYSIVPSVDENYHGSKVASIIGGRGEDKEFYGVAPNCEFAVVKLRKSKYYTRINNENGIHDVSAYNIVEVIAGVEYLLKVALRENKPLVIYIGVGTTSGGHDGKDLASRYLNSITENSGVVVVTGVGNEGAGEGHASGKLDSEGEITTHEINISKDIRNFSFELWVIRPDVVSINIISPYQESTGFINAKINRNEKIDFVLTNTEIEISYRLPDNFYGEEFVLVNFKNIVKGVWKIQLRGEYILRGNYNMWLPSMRVLPEDTKFLESDPNVTLTTPSTAANVITTSYYNSIYDTEVPTSGRGYTALGYIKPDIATAGMNVLAISKSGKMEGVSGSSVAAAIISGMCVLILQWAIINKNKENIYASQVKSYLMYGADRSSGGPYPNVSFGYGKVNILKTFEVIAGIYRNDNNLEYFSNKLFVRIPKAIVYREVYI